MKEHVFLHELLMTPIAWMSTIATDSKAKREFNSFNFFLKNTLDIYFAFIKSKVSYKK